MSGAPGDVPSIEAVVRVLSADRTSTHRECPLCTAPAVADALADPARQADRLGPAAMLGPRVLQHAMALAYAGAPMEIVFGVVLAVWNEPTQVRREIVAAHFWEHGSVNAMLVKAIRTLRVKVRFFACNLLVSPELNESPPVVRLMKDALKTLSEMRGVLQQQLALFDEHGAALLAHPAPVYPCHIPPQRVALERYCVFCHGAHLRGDTLEHMNAYRELMLAYTAELFQLEHARPEMIGVGILARRGTQLLERLYLPSGRDRFLEVAYQHAYGHDESLGALIFAFRHLAGLMLATASARAANMHVGGMPTNEMSSLLRSFDGENIKLVAEAGKVLQLLPRALEKLRESALRQYSDECVAGGPRFEVV